MTQYEFELYDELADILQKLEASAKDRLNTLPNKRIVGLIRQERRYVEKLRKLVRMEVECFVEGFTGKEKK